MKSINPIVIKNIKYYSFNQLIQLGLTRLEIEQYLNLNCKEIVDKSGKVIKLVSKEDFESYNLFKLKFKKYFTNLKK